MSFAVPDVLALVAWALLAVHAVASHGRAFAAIWLGLTAVFGWFTTWYLVGVDHSLRFADSVAAFNGVPLSIGALWAVWIYLGGLLAKGFVERTSRKGEVAPFVVLHAAFTTLVGLAVAIVAHEASWWAGPATDHEAASLFLGGGLFGLLYRVVSKRTEHDPTKLVYVFFACPALVAVHVGLRELVSAV